MGGLKCRRHVGSSIYGVDEVNIFFRVVVVVLVLVLVVEIYRHLGRKKGTPPKKKKSTKIEKGILVNGAHGAQNIF